MARKQSNNPASRTSRGVDRPDPTQNPPALDPLGLAMGKVKQLQGGLKELDALLKQVKREMDKRR